MQFDFDDLRSRVQLSDLLEADGHQLRRNGTLQECRCPFHEERTGSFKVYPDNTFHCFGCGAHGDVTDYIAMRDGCSLKEAADKLAARLGGVILPAAAAPVKRAPVEKPLAEIPPLSVELCATLVEGRRFIMASSLLITRLAIWRGWSEGDTRAIAEAGAILAPEIDGEDTVAFPVCAPEPSPFGGEFQRVCGVHVRFLPGTLSGRTWIFRPYADKATGLGGIPALPMVFGRFSTARLMIVCEGEWDALSFALAAGWIGEGKEGCWPADVCVIGIRGASGTREFLRRWDRYWPPEANALLMPDNDAAGKRWYEARSGAPTFFDEMKRRCRQVIVAAVNGHKDVNEAYKARDFDRETVQGLLAQFDTPAGRRAA